MINGLFVVLLGALFWRLRGSYGWGWTAAFSMLCMFILYPSYGTPGILYSASLMVGELWGWKPKYAKAGRWWSCAGYGLMMGGIGAALVPLSTYLGEKIKPVNSKYYLDNWNEWIFGALLVFTLLAFK